MSRAIIKEQSLSRSLQKEPGSVIENPTAKPDNWAAQIVKLIPADIIAVYLAIQQLLGQTPNPYYIQLAVFILVLAITPFYLKKPGGIKDTNQIIVTTISFVIWAISLGEPFAKLFSELGFPLSPQIIGSVLVMLYTLVVPMFYKSK